MTTGSVFIPCPRFGGCRPASSCITLDRFKTCRRGCNSLAQYIESTPGAVEDALKSLERGSPKLAKSAGKGLPNSKLNCKRCAFTAKSERGLKAHMSRSHKAWGA